MPDRKPLQRIPQSAPSSASRRPKPQTSTHPIVQLQRSVGNQAVVQMMRNGVIQRNGGKDGKPSGWLGPMGGMGFLKKLGMQTMNQTAREAVSAGFGSDSLKYYDLWKLRKDPQKLDQYMRDQIHNMDGEFH